jgi:hypothetical protein
MAITAYAAFVDGVASLTITGVKRRYDAPPDRLTTADLPASFPHIPDDAAQEAPLTADGQGGWPRMAVELVVVIEPTRQRTQAANFAATLAMMDAVAAALRGAAKGSISKGPLSWSIRGGIETVGETEYWCVVARVMGNG